MKRLGSWLDTVRNLPWYFWFGVGVSLVFLVISLVSATSGHVDWAGYQFTIAVFAIAFATLLATLPAPAQLWIERQHELGIDDVIFYIYDEPPLGQVPRDILFQVHIAVANMGGRKAVLSVLRVDAILDGSGKALELPEFNLPVNAQRVQQGAGWRIVDNVMHKHNYLEFIPGPYVLDPDDVITMRLRARHGIDWSANWSLDKLKAFHDALNNRPIKAIRISATFRYANRLRTVPFDINNISVLQQQQYVDELRLVTKDFTTLPNAQPRAITD
jgi:hypothetical protein